jgi:hypothetical protein
MGLDRIRIYLTGFVTGEIRGIKGRLDKGPVRRGYFLDK